MPDSPFPDHPDPEIDPELHRIEDLLCEISPEDHALDPPPSDVWARIEAELAAAEPAPETEPEPAQPDERAEPTRLAEVVPISARRRFAPALIVGAAAAAIVVVAGIVGSSLGGNGASVVANAELAYDAVNFDELGADAEATVSLVDDDGTLRIQIDEAALPTPDDEPADLELWLIEPDADGNVADLVSLGVVDPDDPDSFEVPAGYDPDVYFVVDISVEPRDGDASHSGRSILRGPLQQT